MLKFCQVCKDFISQGFDRVILLGNSRGHIALYHTKMYPEKVAGLVITGSSGCMRCYGDSYQGDYEYIKRKAEDVLIQK
jgi:pimeloyl-ACP methyl ester carboxylesterase